jgi:hypothetical protein
MKTKLEDVIHLYLKCWCEVSNSRNNDVSDGRWALDCGILEMALTGRGTVKPILRKLETMTEEEAKEVVKIETAPRFQATIDICEVTDKAVWYIDGSRFQADGVDELQDLYFYFGQLSSNQFRYLLSRSFDLFGLIPAGLAIEKQP